MLVFMQSKNYYFSEYAEFSRLTRPEWTLEASKTEAL